MSGSTGGAEVRVDVTADIDDLRRNFAAGLVAIQDMERRVEAAQVRLQRGGEATARVTQQQAAANDNAADSSRRLGQVMGQAGFQIQDFAGQVASGQSALVAFGQQGSQLLGIFGPAGAIAGAALTIGVLAAQLLGLGKSAEETSEAQKQLNETMAQTPGERVASAIRTAGDALRGYRDLLESTAGRQRRLFIEGVEEAERAIGRQRAIAVVTRQEAETRRESLAADIAAATERQASMGPGSDTVTRRQLARLGTEYAQVLRQIQQLDGAVRSLTNPPAAQRNPFTNEPIPPSATVPETTVTGRGGRGGGGAAVDPELAESVRALRQAFGDLDGAQNTARTNYERLWESMDPVSRITREYEERLVTLREALSQNAITEQEYATAVGRAVAQREEGIERLSASAQQASSIGREMGTVFTSAFDGILSGSANATDALQRFGQGVARLLERTFITRPLEAAASSLFSAASSSLSSMFGNLFGSSVPAGGGNPNVSFGGPRAAGGPVDPSQWYLVGERGPEIFVPDTAGTIVANDAAAAADLFRRPDLPFGGPRAAGGPVDPSQWYLVGERGPELFVPASAGAMAANDAVSAAAPAMAAAGGGGSPVTINIDARGAEQGVEARIDAVLARRLPGVVNATKASLMADVNRGGRTAQTFGRRA